MSIIIIFTSFVINDYNPHEYLYQFTSNYNYLQNSICLNYNYNWCSFIYLSGYFVNRPWFKHHQWEVNTVLCCHSTTPSHKHEMIVAIFLWLTFINEIRVVSVSCQCWSGPSWCAIGMLLASLFLGHQNILEFHDIVLSSM